MYKKKNFSGQLQFLPQKKSFERGMQINNESLKSNFLSKLQTQGMKKVKQKQTNQDAINI